MDDRSVDEGCRRVALAHLDAALAARARFGTDEEALHDFRVALRRLRSVARAYREYLGRSRPNVRRRLRRLIDATSIARDAEVQLAWIRAQSLDEAMQVGVRAMTERLEARQRGSVEQLLTELASFDGLAARLRKWLSRYQVDLSAEPSRFGEVTARLALVHVEELAESLLPLDSADKDDEAHQARILGKRLRYLVEPFKEDPRVAKILEQLKELQDLLGDFHDAHVAGDELEAALEGATLELHPGLLALLERARERQRLLFEQLQKRWLVGGAAALVEEVRAWQPS